MAKGLDIGTMYVVSARNEEGNVVFRKQRNAFFTINREDYEDSFGCTSPMVVRKGNDVHVVGDDAVRYANLTGASKSFKRPMAKGVLNPSEQDAIGVLQIAIQSVVGQPEYDGEVVAITSPADPLDGSFDTTFHRTVLTRHLKNLGYTPVVLNEAQAIVYSENPTCTSEGQEIPFSGIGISFGAGMVNMVATWRAQKLLEFSVSRGGDWIDQKVSEVTQIPTSRVIKFKEGKFQHSANYTRDHEVKMASALEIYTEDLIGYVLKAFVDKFNASDRSIDDPIEIVIAGGTSLVPGFLELFADVASGMDLPFDIKAVRHAANPLCAVANGALIAADSREKKMLKQKQRTAQAEAPKTVSVPARSTAQAAEGSPSRVRRIAVANSAQSSGNPAPKIPESGDVETEF